MKAGATSDEAVRRQSYADGSAVAAADYPPITHKNNVLIYEESCRGGYRAPHRRLVHSSDVTTHFIKCR